ncbi:tetratricopeptide repeat protein, partial [Roseofilum sp. BLCC_M114]
MDAQRNQAYLSLIQELLRYPSSSESDILEEHRDLLDSGFLEMVQQMADAMHNTGNAQDTERLTAILQRLQNAPDQGKSSASEVKRNTTQPNPRQEEYVKFLEIILKVTLDSQGDPLAVYPLLQQNLDKLDLTLAQILRAWASQKLEQVEPEQRQYIARVIGEFGNLIQQFPLGSRADNLEIAIICYEIAFTVFSQATNPPMWALLQICLGAAYSQRIRGERAENLEEAISAYSLALQVRTREAFPQDWAATQNNLGEAYCNRIRGERAENLEEAISA